MYQTKTNPLVMSRVTKILDKINVSAIPEKDEDFTLFSQSVLMELCSNSEELNSLFQEITGTDDNFLEMEHFDLVEILNSFFVKLGVGFKKLMQTKRADAEKQTDMVMSKLTDLMMTKYLDQIPELNNTAKIPS